MFKRTILLKGGIGIKNKEDIIKILKTNFNYVYCDTCKGNYPKDCEDDYCDDCHRKMMNWGISDHFSELIAKEILK